ncbi:family 78 glycoside hydrolase catalytic domain [Ferruginibacter paludis]|uniref:family 78 glycoside hydrolase catalytic domain n=1 Tax=Ferruginibacter paludis TaxID=1310417 RepID=UPI0025B6076A|nr:family 78 glycoside hydrolase catalytic domain [Ferruginibacter paludis]MDN3657458.1 family 78 glycoside hydrolase catalytic domain [Ferruginibacter paludis]
MRKKFASKLHKSLGLLITILACFLLTQYTQGKNPSLTFKKMLVEYAEAPINVDVMHPRFSWLITSSERNQVQAAYQVMVATSVSLLNLNQPDTWNSGKVFSNETIQHPLGNNKLRSNSIYYWKVIAWNGNGKRVESSINKFETAFLNSGDWRASWIGNGTPLEALPAQGFYKDVREQLPGKDSIVHDGRSLLLRHEVRLTKLVQSARAYVTGLGLYEFFINGQRVGDHVLAPAKTPYQKYVLYDTYDVTALLQPGDNALGIHVGNGWYNPYKKWWDTYRMQWFGSKKAIAQILVRYTDGSSSWITTDNNWRCTPGPVLYSCIYDGEVYDANMDQQGWTNTGYNDAAWKPVTVFAKPAASLVAHTMPAIKVQEIFKPQEINSPKPNTKVFDMGQNFAGWASITTSGIKNTKLTIQFAEDIYADGTLNITSNEHANATAEYILKGDSVETYETHFSFFGFKYVEISAQNGPLNLLNVEGHAVYSTNEPAGNFECDNLLVNKIHQATVWSQKSNMLGYPMDCPQRDERLGWLGDAQVTADEAMYNFNMALFYRNWLAGIRENQDAATGDIPIISPRPYIRDTGIEWSSTYPVLLWKFYTHYGDKQMLAEHYPAMKRFMHFLDKQAIDLMLPSGWIGDWGSMVKGWKEGDPKSIPTAYYYWNATIMAKVAGIIGNTADEVYFKKLTIAIAGKYNSRFLDTKTANYEDGSQMANAFPLFLGIVPGNIRQRVLDNLVKDILTNNSNHLTTGVLGTKYMPEALALLGRADVAWGIINQKTAPSWNDMMRLYTTVCEFWTLKQSKNHVMMGSIDAWFYQYIGGIQPDENSSAFASFIVKPMLLDSLTTATSKIETMRGTISSEWKRQPGLFTLKVQVPFNTSATIYIPGDTGGVLTENGLTVKQLKGASDKGFHDGYHIVSVPSGAYVFKSGIGIK